MSYCRVSLPFTSLANSSANCSLAEREALDSTRSTVLILAKQPQGHEDHIILVAEAGLSAAPAATHLFFWLVR